MTKTYITALVIALAVCSVYAQGYQVSAAYKIAENREIMLPVNVNHDGNYLSYGVEKVELPDRDEVDSFLGEKNTNWHAALDPERPMGVDPLTGGAGGPGPALFVRYRKGSCKAMQDAPYCDFARTTSDPVVTILKHFRSEFDKHVDQKVCPAGVCQGLAKELEEEKEEREGEE